MGAARQLPESGIWDIFDLAPVAGADVESYLDLTLAKCVAWFRASGGSIFLDTAEGEYSLRSRCGLAMELPDSARIRVGEGIGGVVVQSGVGRIVNDPSRDKELAGQPENLRIRSAMVIPLVDTKAKTIGVLNISRRSGERPFTKTDLDQAMALGSHLALAVSNARILLDLQREVGEAASARERLEAVLDSVSGAVIVTDRDGNHITKNEIARQNYSADQEIGVLADAIEEFSALVPRSEQEISYPVYDARSDRTWVLNGVPLATGGSVLTIQEWTEQERNQRENSRMKRLAEIGQMTAAIAHEIRNPLTGIRSAAQMIREHPEVLPDFIGMIEEEALKLNSLCDEFLEFAKPISLNLQEVDLATVVRSQMDLMKWEYEKKGVELRGDFTEDIPTIVIDSRRIGQVVLNLIRNALESSSAGSQVVCRVNGAEFEIEDNGTGISPDDLERLFSPFFTTKSDGTGLGLCNARKVVDAHGGEISVESEVGKGTSFKIVLGRKLV